MPGQNGGVPADSLWPERVPRVALETEEPVTRPESSASPSHAPVAQSEAQDRMLPDGTTSAPVVDAAPASSESEALGEGAAENAAGTIETVVPASGAERELFTALMAAEFSLQDGRVESAAKHYARAAMLSSDPKVAEQAARISLQAGRADLAEQSLKRWRALSPEAGSGLEAADAGLALARGEVADATGVLKPLLGGSEDDRRALVQVLLAPGSKAHLPAALDELGEGKVPGGADGMVLLSQVADQVKDSPRAARFADAAVALAPADADARVWRAHLRFTARDVAGGRADMDRALAVTEEDGPLLLNYASMLSNAGEHAAADSLLQGGKADETLLAARAAYAARANDDARLREIYTDLQALEKPHPATRLELLANLAELLDDNESALAWYRQIGATDPRYLPSQFRVAILRNEMGQAKEALSMVRDLRAAGIEDQGTMAESYMLEAEIVRKDGKPEAVLDIYDQASRLLPGQAQIGYARAVYLESIGRVDEAVADLRALLAKNPDDADALNALGYTLTDRTDRHEEALGFITRALEQKPDEPAIIDSMGWVLYRLGRNEEALEYLRRAWSMQPDPEVGAHLGEVLWVSGEKSEARKVWAAAEKRDEENKVLMATRSRLEK